MQSSRVCKFVANGEGRDSGGYLPEGCTCTLLAFAGDGSPFSLLVSLSLSLPFAMRGRFGGAALLLQTRGIFEESDFLLAHLWTMCIVEEAEARS